ncbi:MAG: caspase family protein [Desulfobacterales bacterium]|nr:caspase family protein [Desulfobacterales bacterium]
MLSLRTILSGLSLVLIALPSILGCSIPFVRSTTVVESSERFPSFVRERKQITIPGNHAGMVSTGIHLDMGETYTLLATGVVDVYPRIGIRKSPADGVLYLKVGKSGTFPALPGGSSAKTMESIATGELRLGMGEGGLGFRVDGSPPHARYYKDNVGSFQVDVIVWETKDYVQIAGFLETLYSRDPKNPSFQDGLKEANTLKEYQLASEKTSKQITETMKQIQDLRTAKETEDKTPSAAESGDGEQANQERIVQLEKMLGELTGKLAQLEETKAKLEMERKKSTALALELEEKERELIFKRTEGPAKPVVMIASPAEGSRIEVSHVALTGVAEHDQGLSRVEFTVNGKPVKKEGQRGLVVKDAEFPKRVDFNERISLDPGLNEIMVKAFDRDGVASERTLNVYRGEMQKNIWAVIIGINSYPKAPQLKYAIDDAKAFQRYLVDQNKIPAENVTLLLNEEATLAKLRSILGTQLKNKAGKEDMVILFFAGHGATERDVMSPDGDGLEKYLLPYDADPKDLYASALPMREVSHIFQRIRSERLIFLVDACYSGASGGRTIASSGKRATISDAFLERITSGRGTIILTASGANEVSTESDDYRHGIFTYFLLQGLKGEADTDKDRLVTVDEAFGYVSKHVPQATGQEQHPMKKGQVEGKLILGVIPKPGEPQEQREASRPLPYN